MNLSSKPWYKKFSIFLYSAGWLVLTSIVLVSELRETNPYIQAEINRTDKKTDTLQTFPDAIVISAGKISVQSASLKIKYLAPRPHMDPVYALFFFLSAVIIVVFFRDFS